MTGGDRRTKRNVPLKRPSQSSDVFQTSPLTSRQRATAPRDHRNADHPTQSTNPPLNSDTIGDKDDNAKKYNISSTQATPTLTNGTNYSDDDLFDPDPQITPTCAEVMTGSLPRTPSRHDHQQNQPLNQSSSANQNSISPKSKRKKRIATDKPNEAKSSVHRVKKPKLRHLASLPQSLQHQSYLNSDVRDLLSTDDEGIDSIPTENPHDFLNIASNDIISLPCPRSIPLELTGTPISSQTSLDAVAAENAVVAAAAAAVETIQASFHNTPPRVPLGLTELPKILEQSSLKSSNHYSKLRQTHGVDINLLSPHDLVELHQATAERIALAHSDNIAHIVHSSQRSPSNNNINNNHNPLQNQGLVIAGTIALQHGLQDMVSLGTTCMADQTIASQTQETLHRTALATYHAKLRKQQTILKQSAELANELVRIQDELAQLELSFGIVPYSKGNKGSEHQDKVNNPNSLSILRSKVTKTSTKRQFSVPYRLDRKDDSVVMFSTDVVFENPVVTHYDHNIHPFQHDGGVNLENIPQLMKKRKDKQRRKSDTVGDGSCSLSAAPSDQDKSKLMSPHDQSRSAYPSWQNAQITCSIISKQSLSSEDHSSNDNTKFDNISKTIEQHEAIRCAVETMIEGTASSKLQNPKKETDTSLVTCPNLIEMQDNSAVQSFLAHLGDVSNFDPSRLSHRLLDEIQSINASGNVLASSQVKSKTSEQNAPMLMKTSSFLRDSQVMTTSTTASHVQQSILDSLASLPPILVLFLAISLRQNGTTPASSLWSSLSQLFPQLGALHPSSSAFPLSPSVPTSTTTSSETTTSATTTSISQCFDSYANTLQMISHPVDNIASVLFHIFQDKHFLPSRQNDDHTASSPSLSPSLIDVINDALQNPSKSVSSGTLDRLIALNFAQSSSLTTENPFGTNVTELAIALRKYITLIDNDIALLQAMKSNWFTRLCGLQSGSTSMTYSVIDVQDHSSDIGESHEQQHQPQHKPSQLPPTDNHSLQLLSSLLAPNATTTVSKSSTNIQTLDYLHNWHKTQTELAVALQQQQQQQQQPLPHVSASTTQNSSSIVSNNNMTNEQYHVAKWISPVELNLFGVPNTVSNETKQSTLEHESTSQTKQIDDSIIFEPHQEQPNQQLPLTAAEQPASPQTSSVCPIPDSNPSSIPRRSTTQHSHTSYTSTSSQFAFATEQPEVPPPPYPADDLGHFCTNQTESEIVSHQPSIQSSSSIGHHVLSQSSFNAFAQHSSHEATIQDDSIPNNLLPNDPNDLLPNDPNNLPPNDFLPNDLNIPSCRVDHFPDPSTLISMAHALLPATPLRSQQQRTQPSQTRILDTVDGVTSDEIQQFQNVPTEPNHEVLTLHNSNKENDAANSPLESDVFSSHNQLDRESGASSHSIIHSLAPHDESTFLPPQLDNQIHHTTPTPAQTPTTSPVSPPHPPRNKQRPSPDKGTTSPSTLPQTETCLPSSEFISIPFHNTAFSAQTQPLRRMPMLLPHTMSRLQPVEPATSHGDASVGQAGQHSTPQAAASARVLRQNNIAQLPPTHSNRIARTLTTSIIDTPPGLLSITTPPGVPPRDVSSIVKRSTSVMYDLHDIASPSRIWDDLYVKTAGQSIIPDLLPISLSSASASQQDKTDCDLSQKSRGSQCTQIMHNGDDNLMNESQTSPHASQCDEPALTILSSQNSSLISICTPHTDISELYSQSNIHSVVEVDTTSKSTTKRSTEAAHSLVFSSSRSATSPPVVSSVSPRILPIESPIPVPNESTHIPVCHSIVFVLPSSFLPVPRDISSETLAISHNYLAQHTLQTRVFLKRCVNHLSSDQLQQCILAILIVQHETEQFQSQLDKLSQTNTYSSADITQLRENMINNILSMSMTEQHSVVLRYILANPHVVEMAPQNDQIFLRLLSSLTFDRWRDDKSSNRSPPPLQDSSNHQAVPTQSLLLSPTSSQQQQKPQQRISPHHTHSTPISSSSLENHLLLSISRKKRLSNLLTELSFAPMPSSPHVGDKDLAPLRTEHSSVVQIPHLGDFNLQLRDADDAEEIEHNSPSHSLESLEHATSLINDISSKEPMISGLSRCCFCAITSWLQRSEQSCLLRTISLQQYLIADQFIQYIEACRLIHNAAISQLETMCKHYIEVRFQFFSTSYAVYSANTGVSTSTLSNNPIVEIQQLYNDMISSHQLIVFHLVSQCFGNVLFCKNARQWAKLLSSVEWLLKTMIIDHSIACGYDKPQCVVSSFSNANNTIQRKASSSKISPPSNIPGTASHPSTSSSHHRKPNRLVPTTSSQLSQTNTSVSTLHRYFPSNAHADGPSTSTLIPSDLLGVPHTINLYSIMQHSQPMDFTSLNRQANNANSTSTLPTAIPSMSFLPRPCIAIPCHCPLTAALCGSTPQHETTPPQQPPHSLIDILPGLATPNFLDGALILHVFLHLDVFIIPKMLSWPILLQQVSLDKKPPFKSASSKKSKPSSSKYNGSASSTLFQMPGFSLNSSSQNPLVDDDELEKEETFPSTQTGILSRTTSKLAPLARDDSLTADSTISSSGTTFPHADFYQSDRITKLFALIALLKFPQRVGSPQILRYFDMESLHYIS